MTPDPASPHQAQRLHARRKGRRGHILAIAAAVAGGGLVTLLVMTSRPAAREESGAGPSRDRQAPAAPHRRGPAHQCRPGRAGTSRAGSATAARVPRSSSRPMRRSRLDEAGAADAGRAMHGQAHRCVRLHRVGRAHRGAGREPHRAGGALTARRHARAMARLGRTRRAVCARRQGHGGRLLGPPDALHVLAAQRRPGDGDVRGRGARGALAPIAKRCGRLDN